MVGSQTAAITIPDGVNVLKISSGWWDGDFRAMPQYIGVTPLKTYTLRNVYLYEGSIPEPSGLGVNMSAYNPSTNKWIWWVNQEVGEFPEGAIDIDAPVYIYYSQSINTKTPRILDY